MWFFSGHKGHPHSTLIKRGHVYCLVFKKKLIWRPIPSCFYYYPQPLLSLSSIRSNPFVELCIFSMRFPGCPVQDLTVSMIIDHISPNFYCTRDPFFAFSAAQNKYINRIYCGIALQCDLNWSGFWTIISFILLC